MSARVALRHDASPSIGLGHARRCAALAAALGARGAEVLHTVPGNVPAGITHVVIDALWRGNAGVVARDVAALADRGIATVVIDSMPPDHYPCGSPGTPSPDLLVTPYLGAVRPARSGGRWLGGADHAVLGAEFGPQVAGAAAPVAAAAGGPVRVLLSCGGSDEDALTAPAARALAEGGATVDVAVGPLFGEAPRAALMRLAANDARVRTHLAPDSLAPLIARADLVVGRPGLVRYEAAALGRFGLYLARGESYRDYFEGFAAAGLAEMHVESDADARMRFLHRLRTIGAASSEQGGRVRSFPPAVPCLVDAGGADRVAEAILDTVAGTDPDRPSRPSRANRHHSDRSHRHPCH